MVVCGLQDSKGKARELSSWESDLKRREAVGFCSPFPFSARLLHPCLTAIFFVAVGYQEEGGGAEKWCVLFWLLVSVISTSQFRLTGVLDNSFCLMQLECRWRRKTGHHSSQSFTMTSPMRFQPMCRSCSTSHLPAGLVCVHDQFYRTCDLGVFSCFLLCFPLHFKAGRGQNQTIVYVD